VARINVEVNQKLKLLNCRSALWAYTLILLVTELITENIIDCNAEENLSVCPKIY
jgi:hypothetical protein